MLPIEVTWYFLELPDRGSYSLNFASSGYDYLNKKNIKDESSSAVKKTRGKNASRAEKSSNASKSEKSSRIKVFFLMDSQLDWPQL